MARQDGFSICSQVYSTGALYQGAKSQKNPPEAGKHDMDFMKYVIWTMSWYAVLRCAGMRDPAQAGVLLFEKMAATEWKGEGNGNAAGVPIAARGNDGKKGLKVNS